MKQVEYPKHYFPLRAPTIEFYIIFIFTHHYHHHRLHFYEFLSIQRQIYILLPSMRCCFGFTTGHFHICFHIFYNTLLIFFKVLLGNHYCLVHKVYMYYRSLYFIRPYKNVKMYQRNSRSQAVGAILCVCTYVSACIG